MDKDHLHPSPDRSGDAANQQKREPGEKPRDKPVEEEADKDVKDRTQHAR
jgi:hypothetical protein